MKIGVRKPSIKRSIKARTTGRLKREAKSVVLPGYGQKGMGYIKDPKRAVYNKVYNKTTIGLPDAARIAFSQDDQKSYIDTEIDYSMSEGMTNPSITEEIAEKAARHPKMYSISGLILIVLGILFCLMGLLLMTMGDLVVAGLIGCVLGVLIVIAGRKYRKIAKEQEKN